MAQSDFGRLSRKRSGSGVSGHGLGGDCGVHAGHGKKRDHDEHNKGDDEDHAALALSQSGTENSCGLAMGLGLGLGRGGSHGKGYPVDSRAAVSQDNRGGVCTAQAAVWRE